MHQIFVEQITKDHKTDGEDNKDTQESTRLERSFQHFVLEHFSSRSVHVGMLVAFSRDGLSAAVGVSHGWLQTYNCHSSRKTLRSPVNDLSHLLYFFNTPSTMNSYIFIVSLLSIGAATARAGFTDAEIFERLSHFKDVGIPGTVSDPVSQAMIVDGTCRLFIEQDGYVFWHNRDAVLKVVQAITNLPSTSHPSNLVLTAHELLPKVCNTTMNAKPTENYSCRSGSYKLSAMANSMNNWQRALCAPESDPAWNKLYDPAYQPQQMALTTGFMCIVACDCNNFSDLRRSTFQAISEDPANAKDAVCKNTPWREVNFTTGGNDVEELARLSHPLVKTLCKC